MDSIFKNGLSGNNGHPSEDDLLLYVDGELASKPNDHLREHLEACWSCRVRTEKIEETISTFIDYRNQVLKPLVEPPPHGWRGFDGKLNKLATEIGRPSVFANLRGALSRILSTANFSVNLRVLWRPVAIALALVIAVAVFTRFNRIPVVSASELLTRATDAQRRAIGATNQAVIYQKLQVKRKSTASSLPETVTWETWNDTTNSRSRHSVEESGTRHFVDAALEGKPGVTNDKTTLPDSLSWLAKVLRANHMNTAMPLSAASFDAWRQSVAATHDEVTTAKLDGNQDAFVLRTISTGELNDGQISEASLIVRATDWHPVAENLRVKGPQGDEELELSEAAYAVVSLNTLPPEIFPAQPAVASASNSPTLAAKKETEQPLAANVQPATPVVATADLEVEALRLLHEAHADLGEQITATRGADGLLHVTGLVDSNERKAEIIRALQPIANDPACRIEIQTVAEAVAQQQQQRIRSKATPAPVTEQKVEINSETIAAAPELRKHFNSDEQMREFAGRMISQSRSAMRHAYAMKRLIEQFSAEQLRTLSPEAKNKWLALIRSHAAAYQSEIGALRRELKPIFSSSSSGPGVAGVEIKDDASLARAVEQLFNLASSNDGVIRSAFSTTSGNSATSAIGSPQFWTLLNDAESSAARIARAQ